MNSATRPSRFGAHDVSSVEAHTDRAAHEGAVAVGARAFASGDHVAFAGAPDLHTAAHEAAHVVQQRAGVSVQHGVGKVGDKYESHADAVKWFRPVNLSLLALGIAPFAIPMISTHSINDFSNIHGAALDVSDSRHERAKAIWSKTE